MCLARRDRWLERFGVHVSRHEQLARGVVGRHGRYQAALVAFGGEIGAFFDLLDAAPRGESLRHKERLVRVSVWAAIIRLVGASFARDRRIAAGGRCYYHIDMGLQLYNTLHRARETFVPGDAKRVTMYVCGPTVYSSAHIGNARPNVVFDVLARLLRRSYGLVYVRNITDVDERLHAAAHAEGVPIGVVSRRHSA